jgi:hypothetical protein
MTLHDQTGEPAGNPAYDQPNNQINEHGTLRIIPAAGWSQPRCRARRWAEDISRASGCQLRNPSGAEIEKLVADISTLGTLADFCRIHGEAP